MIPRRFYALHCSNSTAANIIVVYLVGFVLASNFRGHNGDTKYRIRKS